MGERAVGERGVEEEKTEKTEFFMILHTRKYTSGWMGEKQREQKMGGSLWKWGSTFLQRSSTDEVTFPIIK